MGKGKVVIPDVVQKLLDKRTRHKFCVKCGAVLSVEWVRVRKYCDETGKPYYTLALACSKGPWWRGHSYVRGYTGPRYEWAGNLGFDFVWPN